jgi:hypothetical protein
MRRDPGNHGVGGSLGGAGPARRVKLSRQGSQGWTRPAPDAATFPNVVDAEQVLDRSDPSATIDFTDGEGT